MILSATDARAVNGGRRRLDAAYFCSPGIQASAALERIRHKGIETVTVSVASGAGLGSVYHPNRFKRMLAAQAEEAMPFLRAFDVFEYLPQPSDWISVPRTEGIDELRVVAGDILLTRSGRNLGPAVVVDSHLEQFIPSDDLLRIRIKDVTLRHYAFAYLSSPIGQQLLRQDKTGSVIDHLSAGQVGSQAIPVVDDIVRVVADKIARSVELRGTARHRLTGGRAGLAGLRPRRRAAPMCAGWTVKAAELSGRLDAAFHAEDVQKIRERLLGAGGVRLGDVASVLKPGGRYKTYYVSPEHGTPLLSGRNLLQAKPIAMKHISSRSIAEDSGYELRAGSICFQADGRAEERLGFPVMLTSDREGWLASGHVARVAPVDPQDSGWLWSAIATAEVQQQLAALACGSVVDALYESDLRNVIIPPRGRVDHSGVVDAWELFAQAAALEDEAVTLVQSAVVEAGRT